MRFLHKNKIRWQDFLAQFLFSDLKSRILSNNTNYKKLLSRNIFNFQVEG